MTAASSPASDSAAVARRHLESPKPKSLSNSQPSIVSPNEVHLRLVLMLPVSDSLNYTETGVPVVMTFEHLLPIVSYRMRHRRDLPSFARLQRFDERRCCGRAWKIRSHYRHSHERRIGNLGSWRWVYEEFASSLLKALMLPAKLVCLTVLTPWNFSWVAEPQTNSHGSSRGNWDDIAVRGVGS